LHAAAHKGHKEVTALLIAKGADVNAKTDDGWTSLHFAAVNGHKEVAELLISSDADVNAKMEDKWTPLDTAIVGFAFVAQGKVTMHKHPELADLLRKQGGKTGEELKAEGK
jgi:hypothetical protein